MKTLMPFKVLEAFACCLMDIVDDMANSVNDYGNDLQQLEGMQPLNMLSHEDHKPGFIKKLMEIVDMYICMESLVKSYSSLNENVEALA